MRCFVFTLLLCLHFAWTSTLTAPETCNSGCMCSDGEDDGGGSITKLEGLAVAVGVLTPLVMGGAGLGLYKLLKNPVPNLSRSDVSPKLSSPRMLNKRGPIANSNKDSPGSSYRGTRRGSTPLSLLGEDDDISFSESPRSGHLHTTGSNYPNVHRPYKGDAVNRWL